MRSTIKIFTNLVLSVCLFAACDNIPEEERLISIQETSDEAPITASPSMQRVLLEDFTGWRCTNCPEAAKTISELEEKFQDKLIVMAIHGTSFARPNQENHLLDLRTEQGNHWITNFGISNLPIGMVNRQPYSGSLQIAPPDWENSINAILTDENKHTLDLNMGIVLKSTEKKLLVSVETIFLKNCSDAMTLSLVVLESNIEGVQKNDEPSVGAVPQIDNYMFNHVMREHGSFDNVLTEDNKTYSAGDTIKKSYLLTCSEDWKLNNCKIVCFVSNANTKEIVQVNVLAVPQ